MSLNRHERGIVGAVSVVALTLLMGLLPVVGSAAQGATDPTPTATSTTSTASALTPDVKTTTAAPSVVLPKASAATIYGSPGQTSTVNVLAHDACNGSTVAPCPYSALVGSRLAVSGSPAVTGVSASVLSNGVVSIAVASSVRAGTVATFKYTIHDKYGTASNTIKIIVGHAPVTPNVGTAVWTGKTGTYDLLAHAKCDNLQSPCPSSALKKITIGSDPYAPLTTATVSPTGVVTISVGPHQPPFAHAHLPYTILDKYGKSTGLLVVSFYDSYNPKSRMLFNNPLGNGAQQQSIDQAIVDLANHAPKGATIEMISYTVDGSDITYALVNAFKRGVNVRVLQGQGIISGNVPFLQQTLGTNQTANSFYHICRAACRAGSTGVPHTKVFAVTKSGRATNALVSASSNYSFGGSTFQWFDGYELVNNAAAYAGFDHVFQESRLDKRPTDWTGLNYAVSGSVMYTYPRIVTSLSQMAAPAWPACAKGAGPGYCYRTVPLLAGSTNDWLEQQLAQVSCYAGTGYGTANHRTIVRVSVRALQGARGYDVAHMLRLLADAGCDVRVITTQPSSDAVRELQRPTPKVPGGVWVGDQTWRWKYQVCSTDDSSGYTVKTYCWLPGLYTHMHALAVSGGFNGGQANLVWTGSESWATDAYYNDEQVVRLSGAGFFNSFMGVFNYNWSHYTHAPGLKPLGDPPAAPVTYP